MNRILTTLYQFLSGARDGILRGPDIPRRRISLRWVAITGALVFAIATWVAYNHFIALTMVPAGATAGFVLYAIFDRPRHRPEQTLNQLSLPDGRVPTVLTIGFLVTSSISVVIAAGGEYTLPLGYYVFLAGSGTILFCRIILTEATRSNLVLVCLYGLNSFGSIHFAFPGLMGGPDHGYHLRLVTHIYETGSVIDGPLTYAGFPGQHLSSAMLGQTVGFTPNVAYLAMGLGGMLIGLPLTYLVGVRLVDSTFALLAMVLYASMSYVVFRGAHPTQQAHLLPLTFLLFVTAIYAFTNPEWRYRILVLIAGFSLIISHHYNSFVAGFMLFAVFLGYRFAATLCSVLNRIIAEELPLTSDDDPLPNVQTHWLMLIVIFGMSYAVHMTYTSGYFTNLVGYLLGFVRSLFQEPADPLSQTPRFADIPPELFFLNTAGEALLVMLIILGAFSVFLHRNQIGITILLWLAVAGGLAMLGVVVDFPFVIPQRVYVLAQITAMGFLAAVGLVYLFSNTAIESVSTGHIGAIAGVVFLLIFFSTASTVAGLESSPFNDGVTYPIQYEMAEEQQAETFWTQVGVDEEEIQWERQFEASEEQIDFAEASGTIGINYHRIETGVTVQGGSGIGARRYVIPSDPARELQTTTHLYDNGEIEIYSKI